MTERKKSAPRSRRSPSAKAIEAGKANLAKGRAKKAEETEKAHEQGREPAGARWAKLLDGTITVADLDDEEIAKMQVRGADGGFAGRKRRVPSHLAQQMKDEAIKRATEQFRVFAPKAVKRLLEIAEDPDTKPADAIRALDIALNRGLGKTPETIRVESGDPWAKLLNDVAGVGLDREMADLEEQVRGQADA
jgi:hypothetical protein